MSRGNKIVPLRLSAETLAAMEARIERRNASTREEPWTVSDYIRHCIARDLAHIERGKKSRKPRATVADTYTAAAAVGAASVPAPQTGQTGQEESE